MQVLEELSIKVLMIFCHHLCGNLGSLKRNGDSTRALQSSTSLFVAFITGPR